MRRNVDTIVGEPGRDTLHRWRTALRLPQSAGQQATPGNAPPLSASRRFSFRRILRLRDTFASPAAGADLDLLPRNDCMRHVILCLIGAVAISGCGSLLHAPRPSGASPLAAAEAFVDAFYSFDPERLRETMSAAPESVPRIVYYQGWAEGGNYLVVQRMPCRAESAELVTCSITVKDDLIQALGTGFDVTDTFHLGFEGGRIVSVRTTSNDPPEFDRAMEWVQNERSELVDEPCRDAFEGGPTPQACVRAMVQGFREFAALPRS